MQAYRLIETLQRINQLFFWKEPSMLVMKFGGTSVKDAPSMKRVCTIIESRLHKHPAVVVSAVSGVTDTLVSLCRGRCDAREVIDDLKARHMRMAAELGLNDPAWEQALDHALSSLLRLSGSCAPLIPRHADEMKSIGEFLSAHLLAASLRKCGIDADMFDARGLIATDSSYGSAVPDTAGTACNIAATLLPFVKSGRIPIIQGFVGADTQGHTTTLGRGGSDYSATIIGSLAGAEQVEIWSDVPGILTADPSIVPEARRITHMSFAEASELAYFGARVLHPASILPAIENNIPVAVLNSMCPLQGGTHITKNGNAESKTGIVKSIAYKEDLTVITVSSTRMLMAYGFMAEIFKVFEKYKTPVDLVTTSEVSVSVTIDSFSRLQEIMEELRVFASADHAENKAIVCVVGDTLKNDHAIMGKIFHLLNDVPIHMVSQGASEITISFVIDNADIEQVVNTLHSYFFNGHEHRNMFVKINQEEWSTP